MRSYADIDAHGADALVALARVGWTVEEADPTFRAGGDLLTTHGFTLGRIWHTSMRARSAPATGTGEDEYVAMLIVEGRGICTIDGNPVTFEPGMLLIYDAAAAAVLETPSMTAAIHVSHFWNAILPAGMRRDDVPAAIRPPERFLALLAAMVNTTFEHRLEQTDLGFPAWLTSINAAVSALLSSTLENTRTVASPSTLFDRATALIDERHTQPEFTVADIAAHFGVSTAWLHQAFADRGTTPRRVLQGVRVAHARTLLPQLPTPAEIAAAAIASGFGTGRALRRALRTGDDDARAAAPN